MCVFFNLFILYESYGFMKEADISCKANSWTFMAPLVLGKCEYEDFRLFQ